MKTARAWGGFSSVKALADVIPDHGYSEDTLTDIENGVADRVTTAKLGRIAEACGVPKLFLTDESYDPFNELVGADDLFAVLDEIREQTSQIGEGMTMLRGLANEDMIRRILPGGGEQS